MANTAEELLLRISGDATGGKQALGETAVSIDGLFGQIAGGVAVGEELSKAFDLVITAATEAVKVVAQFAVQSLALGDSLYTTAQKTGASVENLSALKFAAAQAGVDFDRVTGSFFLMEKALGQTGEAGQKTQEVIAQLGLNFKEIKNESPDQAFIDVVSAISQVPNQADRAKDAMVLFGRGGREIMGLLNTDLAEVIASAKDLGLIMTTQQAAAAHAATVGWEAFTQQLSIAGVAIMSEVAPALVALEKLASQAFGELANDLKGAAAGEGASKIDQLLIRIGEGFIAATAAAAGFAEGATQGLVNVVQMGARVGQALDSIGFDLVKIATLGTVDPRGKTALDQLAASFQRDYTTFETFKTSVGSVGDAVTKAFSAVESVADGMAGKFSTAFKQAQESIDTFAAKAPHGLNGVSEATDELTGKQKHFAEVAKSVEDQLEGTDWDGTAASALKLGVSVGNVAVYFGLSDGAAEKLKDQIKTMSDIVKIEASPSLAEFSGKLRELGINTTQDTQNMMGLVAAHALEAKATVGITDGLDKIGRKEVETVPRAILDAQRFTKEIEQLGSAFTELASTFAATGGKLGVTLSAIAQEFGNIASAIGESRRAALDFADAKLDFHLAQNNTEKLTASFEGLKSIVSEINVMAKATSGGGLGAIAGGALAGEQFGAQFGPEGAAVGGVVGGVTGIVRDIFGSGPSKEELQSRTDRSNFLTQFQSSAGFDPTTGAYNPGDATGIQSLADKLASAGLTAEQSRAQIDALLNAKTPQAFAAAMDPVNRELEAVFKHDQDVKTFNANIEKSITDVSQMVSSFESAGHVIPQSMLATIQSLMKLPGLTDAERTSLQQLVDGAKPNFDNLETIAEKYGVTLQGLGPKLAQGQLDTTAQGIYQDFEDLTNAGGEAGNVIGAMHDKIQDLVRQAIDSGQALPEFMQPLIQNLAGDLKDTHGNLIDITKIKFDDTPTADGLGDMTSKLTDIQDELKHGVPDALHDLLSQIPTNPFGGWNIPNLPTGDGSADGASTGGLVTALGIQHFGTGGVVRRLFRPIGTDTVPAMLTPGEMVLNARQQGALASHMNGGGITVHVDASGSFFRDKQSMDYLARTVADALNDRMKRVGGQVSLR